MSALSSSLLTGLSGLVVNQTELGVVGNNIANANTTAFKESDVLFSPQFYVTDGNGAPATGDFGGTNPSQVGLGAQVAAITQNLTQGQFQTTGIPSDLAIDGNGYFVVKSSSVGTLYTRDGAFSVNDDNQLVDTSGDFVQGYGVTSDFQVNAGGTLGAITIPYGEPIAQATQNASLEGTLNAGGTVATSASVLTSQSLQTVGGGTLSAATLLTSLQDFGATGTTTLVNSGDVLTLSGKQGTTSLQTATFTVSSTSTVQDLENFFDESLAIATPPTATPGVTPGAALATVTGGGQAITVTGNVGDTSGNALTIAGLTTSNGDSGFTLETDTSAPNGGVGTGESAHTSTTVYDSLGNPITLNVNAVLVGDNPSGGTNWDFYVTSPQEQGGSQVVATGTLGFSSSGSLTSSSGTTITLDRAGTGAEQNQLINLNFGGVQALNNVAPSTTSAPSNTDSSTLDFTSQDGFATGTLQTYSIGANGIITGAFSNGLNETVGQVALATFANPQGLVNQGNNQYTAGANSGNATITTPTNAGAGSLVAGSLEMSNVDLSQEFINLIVASTGYDASSRVISTSDQLLTQLLNSQGG